MNEGIVIVGSGVAAFTAADTLRREGYDQRITMIGDEPDSPYERPPLSKKYLRGEVARDAVQLRPLEYFAQKDIDLALGDRVVRIDPGNSLVELAKGREVHYEQLLVATGASLRRMQIPGSRLDGIHYLRTVGDCDGIREAVAHRPHVLIVGAGFIGCEVAASLRQLGCATTLLGSKLPLEHVLGAEVGQRYADYHRAHGVDVKGGVSVVEFRGSTRVEQALLSDRTTVSCDAVVVGIGVMPRVDALPPGLQLENGIVTDEFCRTSIERVWAAGDAAASWRPRLGVRARFEHFMNAQLQGSAAAKNMLGKKTPYDPIPYFWSDQFELSLQYFGSAAASDVCVVRGKPSQPAFLAFYLRDGRIEAACIVNEPKLIIAAKKLLGRTGISPSLLEDEGTDLDQLSA